MNDHDEEGVPSFDEDDKERQLVFTVTELGDGDVDDAEQVVFTRSTSTSCSTS